MNADDQFASFEVCGSCYTLRGPFDYFWQGERFSYMQECRCDRDKRPSDERQAKWFTFDFNTVAELCQCCGAEVLKSGSRWSVWFCDQCKPRAVAFNERAGAAILPIGRHSMMNRVGFSVTPTPSKREIGAFVDRFGNLVERMKHVDDWSHEVVRRNIADLGLNGPATIPLGRYLAGAETIDRSRRFDEMTAMATRVFKPS